MAEEWEPTPALAPLPALEALAERFRKNTKLVSENGGVFLVLYTARWVADTNNAAPDEPSTGRARRTISRLPSAAVLVRAEPSNRGIHHLCRTIYHPTKDKPMPFYTVTIKYTTPKGRECAYSTQTFAKTEAEAIKLTMPAVRDSRRVGKVLSTEAITLPNR